MGLRGVWIWKAMGFSSIFFGGVSPVSISLTARGICKGGEDVERREMLHPYTYPSHLS